jgi:hypothetical protein
MSLHYDGTGGGGGAGGVFGHVLDNVGRRGGRIERDEWYQCAVHEVAQAEIGVGLGGAGYAGAEVVVAVADVEVGGVVSSVVEPWMGAWFCG